MNLSIEQSQLVLDLRRRMLENVQAGKPAEDGLTAEDYNKALNAIRGSRALAAQAATNKPKRGKKAASAEATTNASSALDNPKFAKFKNLNLD